MGTAPSAVLAREPCTVPADSHAHWPSRPHPTEGAGVVPSECRRPHVSQALPVEGVPTVAWPLLTFPRRDGLRQMAQSSDSSCVFASHCTAASHAEKRDSMVASSATAAPEEWGIAASRSHGRPRRVHHVLSSVHCRPVHSWLRGPSAACRAAAASARSAHAASISGRWTGGGATSAGS